MSLQPHLKRALAVLAAAVVIALLFWATGPFWPTELWVTKMPVLNQPLVALSFDDGPNETWTPEVLDILDEFGVKATFFVVGADVQKEPGLARQIAQRGHEIGNHSFDHSPRLPFKLPWTIKGDYRRAEEVIFEATGESPRLYRAPHGRLSPWMAVTLRSQGVQLVGWDDSSDDWKVAKASVLIDRVMAKVRPGSIVLLHDGLDLNSQADRAVLVAALPVLIEELEARGFELTTVGALLNHPSSPGASATVSPPQKTVARS